jgi:hypothetical protein
MSQTLPACLLLDQKFDKSVQLVSPHQYPIGRSGDTVAPVWYRWNLQVDEARITSSGGSNALVNM